MNKFKHIIVAAFLMTAFLLLSANADAQTYGGRSIGVSATINNGTPTNYIFADTGQLPASGGNITISVPSSSIPGVMTTGVLTASTSGALRSSQSVTVANDVDITVGGDRIRANRAIANAGCICCPGVGDATCSGSSTFNGLTVNGQPVAVSGQPNQVVNLPSGGTLTLNEQIAGVGTITVNAMHIEGATHNIIVSSATSSLECLVTGPTPADVTVSGRVLDKFGRGISRATVTLTDGSGAVRTTSTNSLGHFSFADVESGTSIVLEASARGYTFSPKVVRVEDDTSVDIVAN